MSNPRGRFEIVSPRASALATLKSPPSSSLAAAQEQLSRARASRAAAQASLEDLSGAAADPAPVQGSSLAKASRSRVDEARQAASRAPEEHAVAVYEGDDREAAADIELPHSQPRARAPPVHSYGAAPATRSSPLPPPPRAYAAHAPLAKGGHLSPFVSSHAHAFLSPSEANTRHAEESARHAEEIAIHDIEVARRELARARRERESAAASLDEMASENAALAETVARLEEELLVREAEYSAEAGARLADAAIAADASRAAATAEADAAAELAAQRAAQRHPPELVRETPEQALVRIANGVIEDAKSSAAEAGARAAARTTLHGRKYTARELAALSLKPDASDAAADRALAALQKSSEILLARIRTLRGRELFVQAEIAGAARGARQRSPRDNLWVFKTLTPILPHPFRCHTEATGATMSAHAVAFQAEQLAPRHREMHSDEALVARYDALTIIQKELSAKRAELFSISGRLSTATSRAQRAAFAVRSPAMPVAQAPSPPQKAPEERHTVWDEIPGFSPTRSPAVPESEALKSSVSGAHALDAASPSRSRAATKSPHKSALAVQRLASPKSVQHILSPQNLSVQSTTADEVARSHHASDWKAALARKAAALSSPRTHAEEWQAWYVVTTRIVFALTCNR